MGDGGTITSIPRALAALQAVIETKLLRAVIACTHATT